MITLRDYQQDVVESIYKTQKRGITRQLVVMSTGLGKSFTLTQVILDHVKRGKRTLVLVDQEDLVWQWKNYIHSMDANIRVGIEKAEYKSKLTDQVVIATVQTLGRKGVKRIKRFKPDHFSYCVADECFTPDVEILTEDGFVRFDELQKGKRVAQYHQDTKGISFVEPTRYIKREHNGKIYDITSQKGIDLSMTPNHELLVATKHGDKKELCKDIKFNQSKRIYVSGKSLYVGSDKVTEHEKLMIALQADGSIHRENVDGTSSLLFSFSKERKIEKFLQIMERGNFRWDEIKSSPRKNARKKRRRFIVKDVQNPDKDITKHFDLTKITYQKAVNIINECVLWDGHVPKNRDNSLYYSNTDKKAVDFYQSVAILANYKTNQIIQTDDRSKTFNDVHRLFINTKDTEKVTTTFKKEVREYKGYVYCVEVPEHNIIVRRNGKVAVVGNCHKSISKTWFRVLNYFGFGKENFTEGNLLTGCTATPFRNSGESLGILFDDIVANYDLRFAMSEGWLTDISLYDVKTSTDLSKYKNQGEFDQAVNNEARNLEALKAYKQISNGEQALIYTASVDHAYELVELFNKNGIPSEVIEANTDKTERKEFLKDYKTKDVRCLMNFGTLTTGTDLPETSTLMLLRPVQSKLLLTQILGRGLRPSASAMVDRWQTKEDRLNAIMLSKKPFCKIIDLHDKVGKHNFAHIPSLFGLHNKLKTKQPKQFFKEVVEPLDNAKKEHGVDISQITDPDDIKLIVKNRKVEIKSLRTPQHIQEFTDRSWVQIDNGFEILYDDNALIIEKDNAKSELVDKEEWNLFVYNTKDQLTKKLQTFNSLSGAFKIADEYADAQKWNKRFVKKEPWNDLGVTEGQLNMLTKFFVYNNGYSKFRTLEERYPDTNLRKVYWKPTGEVLDRGMASKIISDFFNNK